MDANQRECLDEHLICVYLCPFAVENGTSRFVFFNKDFVRISVLSKVGDIEDAGLSGSAVGLFSTAYASSVYASVGLSRACPSRSGQVTATKNDDRFPAPRLGLSQRKQ